MAFQDTRSGYGWFSLWKIPNKHKTPLRIQQTNIFISKEQKFHSHTSPDENSNTNNSCKMKKV